jgi:hypothetical protein
VNEELANRYEEALLATVGPAGRMITASKSSFREANPDHVLIFNANLCLAGGKIWHGDLDIDTPDEQLLIELAARIGEAIYVLHERAARFENEDEPQLEEAVYSVAPSGHTMFDHPYIERTRDGSLRMRPPQWRQPKRRRRPSVRRRLRRLWRRTKLGRPGSYQLGRGDEFGSAPVIHPGQLALDLERGGS